MSNLVKYRKDIDGLRALAVMSVIIFHLKPTLLPSGFIGVDIFFVISGFLITKILLRELQTNQFSFSKFYIRRIRRIFPALFVMLFFSFIIAILILGTRDLLWFCKTLKYSTAQISNFLFQEKVEYFDTKYKNTPLLHTWSLGVEEQFYLFFPLILYFIVKFKKQQNFIFYIMIFLSLISLILSQYLLITHPKIAFFSLPSRFWELGIGAILAFEKIKISSKKINESVGIIGLAMIIISFFIIDKNNFPAIYALPACLGAALIILSDPKNTITEKLLSNKILVFIGIISYSLYLWHYPLITFYKEFAEIDELNSKAVILIFFISLIISYLSYKYVETPFRKKSFAEEKYFNLSRYKIYQPFLASALCIIFFLTTIITVKTWQENKDDKIFGVDINSKLNAINKECIVGEKTDFSENFISQCVKGKNKNNFEVLLIGDIHAWRYAYGLMEWSKNHHYSMAVIASTACPSFIDNGTKFCGWLQKNIDKLIADHKSLKYVVMANKWDDDVTDKNFIKGLEKNIQNFNKQNKKVIILGSVPILTFDPIKCIAKNHALIHDYFPSLKKSDCEKELRINSTPQDDSLKKIFTNLTSKYNAKYFDPKPYLCDKNYCYSSLNGKILYTDSNHLNFDASVYLGGYFDF